MRSLPIPNLIPQRLKSTSLQSSTLSACRVAEVGSLSVNAKMPSILSFYVVSRISLEISAIAVHIFKAFRKMQKRGFSCKCLACFPSCLSRSQAGLVTHRGREDQQSRAPPGYAYSQASSTIQYMYVLVHTYNCLIADFSHK